jgi:hypothetical protein
MNATLKQPTRHNGTGGGCGCFGMRRKTMILLCWWIGWFITLQLAYRQGQQQSTLTMSSSSSSSSLMMPFGRQPSQQRFQPQQLIEASSDAATNTNAWEHLWWASNLQQNSLLHVDDHGFIVFPSYIRRVWIDVGVHAQSEFLPQLSQQSDLFLIGFEPSLTVYRPCPPTERCVILWAACIPHTTSSSISNDHPNDTSTTTTVLSAPHMVNLYLQKFGGMCNSLLRSTTHRGCVRPKLDEQGQPRTIPVPGIPLSSLLSRIPTHITVEYIKIDAQGYDLQVMQGALYPPSSSSTYTQYTYALPQVVSLEAMDVTNKSYLLYHDQPTLQEIVEVMQQDHGWTYVTSTNNTALIKEVNAFFVSNASYAYKVESILQTKKSNIGRIQG